MRAWWCLLVLAACEGRVGELGEEGPAGAVIRDWSGPQILAFGCDASSIETRAPLTCTVEARHPTAAETRCRLDPGDGRPVLELGDCAAAPRTVVVRFASPGGHSLLVTAIDGQDRVASRAVGLQVTGLPNQPPLLSNLSASRVSGVAPLQTSLAWTVSDPEGDAVSCALDVGADGTIEHPAFDCAAPPPLTIRTVGAVQVKVSATDAAGLVTEQLIALSVAPPTADLRVEKIELGQSVLAESPTLVEDKAALLRVTVLANEAGLATAVQLEAKQGATVLGTRTFDGPTVAPTSVGPGELAKTWRTLLPREWIVPGLTLAVRVDPTDAVLEADEGNNAQTLSPSVGQGNVLHLTQVPVVHAGLTGETLDLEEPLTALWPLKQIDSKTRAPYTFTGTISPTDVAGWSQLLGELAQVQGADGSARAYYGLVKPNFGGGVAGIGYVGQHVATGRDDSSQVAAHELGHNFGINHAPCGGASGADPAYPYAGAKIGSWGVRGTQLLEPSRYVDVMSYCGPTWISDYNYALAQRHMRGNGTFDPTATLPAVLEDVLLVSARIDAAGRVTLGAAFRLHAARRVPDAASETRLRLVTEAGARLELPVTWQRPAEGGEGHFFALVPWPGALARVELLRGAQVLAAREAGAASLTAEVQREATALRVRPAPGVHVTVAHLSGGERTTLTVDAQREVAVQLGGLSGGTFEVSLSDGVAVQREFVPSP